jgi:hypothetical protein
LTNDPDRSPTATQLVALVHVIAANRAFKLSVGPETIDHVLPFHRSINTLLWAELSMDSPTAKHWEAFVHAMPDNVEKCTPAGLGLGTTDHDVPFQRSISVALSELLVGVVRPTAKHVVALAHATSDSSLCRAPAGSALGTIDQLVPFQCSTNVNSFAPLVRDPTAAQNEPPEHPMPRNELS